VAEAIFQAEHALEDAPPHHRGAGTPARGKGGAGDA
jgi:hypothetical protein